MNIFTSGCFSQWIYISLCHEWAPDLEARECWASFIQSVKNDQNNIYVTRPVEKSQLQTLDVKIAKIPLELVTRRNPELTSPSGLLFILTNK